MAEKSKFEIVGVQRRLAPALYECSCDAEVKHSDPTSYCPVCNKPAGNAGDDPEKFVIWSFSGTPEQLAVHEQEQRQARLAVLQQQYEDASHKHSDPTLSMAAREQYGKSMTTLRADIKKLKAEMAEPAPQVEPVAPEAPAEAPEAPAAPAKKGK